MTAPWSDILADAGAEWSGDGTLRHFADPLQELHAAEETGIVTPLTEMGVLGAYGEDARDFLHGQLTHSVTDLPPDRWRLAGYCSPKGRLLALFRLLADDGGVLALTHGSLQDATLQRLHMFVLRARVALEDLNDRLAAVGLAGPPAGELLAELAGTPPAEPGAVTEAGDLRVLRLNDAGGPRFVLLAPHAELAAVWHMLGRGLTPAGRDAWELLAIRAGEPEITAATREAFVPQMVNLELIDGVSFGKGCYPGQEIVARMHYRGQAKRRMFRVSTAGTDLPEIGAAVRTAGGQEAGAIVRAAPNTQNRAEALAVLSLQYAANEALYVDERPLQLDTLPYPIPTGE